MWKKCLLTSLGLFFFAIVLVTVKTSVAEAAPVITTSSTYTPNGDSLYPAFNDGLPYWSWKDTVEDGYGAVGPIDGVQFRATGGTGPHTWSVVSGQLPHGLQLSSTGWLHGTPLIENTYNFTVRVSDGASQTDKAMTLTVYPRRTKAFEDWKLGLMGGPFVWNGGTSRTGANMAAFESGLSTFDADDFVQDIKDVGIRYMIVNANLGGGDIYFPTTVPTDYNRVLTRDLVEELVTALHNNNMKAFVGINFNGEVQGDTWTTPGETYQGRYLANKLALVRELLQSYAVGSIDGMWIDGNAAMAGPEGTNAFWQLLRTYQPFAVGLDNHTYTGLYDFMNNNDKRFTDIVNEEAQMDLLPATAVKKSEDVNGFHKTAEVEQPIEYAWGWNGPGTESGIRSAANLVQMMVRNVSMGTNYMLNWGVEQPQYGTYVSYAASPYRPTLNGIGSFMDANGDSIYGTHAGPVPGGKYPHNAEVYSTKKAGKVFLHLFSTKLLKLLSQAGWTATASSSGGADTPGRAVDGDMSTRWTTGANQTNGQWFSVDLGATQSFNRIVMDAGGSSTHYPRGYQVFVSSDGINWGSAVATGTGLSAATEATFNVASARYIKVVQTGTAAVWWSIHDFKVYNSVVEVPLAGAASSVYLVRNNQNLMFAQSGGILSVTLENADFDPNGFDTVIGVNIPNKVDPDAAITASSFLNAANSPDKALDGVKGLAGTGEWASNGETTPWVKFDWGSAYRTIDKVLLYDRPDSAHSISAGRLDFSDGTFVNVGALPNDGTPLTVEFAGKAVTWVKFTVTGGSGTVGLSEMEAVEAADLALDAKVTAYGDGSITASSYFNDNHRPQLAGDGIRSLTEWASNGELTPWIKFDFGTQVKTLNKVTLYDRPNTTDNISAGRLDFSDGTFVNVGALPTDGSALEVVFPTRSVTWVKFIVTTGAGFAVGLAEAEFGTPANTQLALSDIFHTVGGAQAIGQLDLWDPTGGNPWIKLDYNNNHQTVNQAVLYSRRNAGTINAGRLDFSDGSYVNVGALPTNGSPLVVSFAGRTVKWVTFTVTSGTGLVGLERFELYREKNLADQAAAVASSVLDRQSVPLDISDTFDSTALDSHWSWVREDNTKWSLTSNSGFMTLTTQFGGIESTNTSAKNILLKNSVGDHYSLETKLNLAPTQDYQQAGLVMYNDDNNFIKLVKAYITSGVRLQFAKETAGSTAVIAEVAAPAGADIHLRLTKTGSRYNAYYSTDGVAWTLIGSGTALGSIAKDGLIAYNGEVSAASIPAKFDYIRTASYGISDAFGVAGLADYWSWVGEDNTKWSLTSNSGFMTLTTQYGGIEGPGAATAKNVLLKNASGENYAIETKVNFSPTQNFQQAGLVMYNDNNHFIKLVKAYVLSGVKLQFMCELAGSMIPIAEVDAPAGADIYLKLNKYNYGTNQTHFDAYYSTDGVTWAPVGSTSIALTVLKDGLIAYNGEVSATGIPAKFDYLDTYPLVAADSFSGATPADYWSWLREDNTKWSLTSNPGYMTLTTQYGGIEISNVSAKNMLLKNTAGGNQTVETKLSFSPTQDYQQAGLLLYGDDDNFVKLVKAYVTSGAKLQFAHEVAGSFTVVAEIDAPAGADIYLKLIKLTNHYDALYSTNGRDWTLLGHTAVNLAIRQDGLIAYNGEVTAASIDAKFDYMKTTLKNSEDLWKMGGPKAAAFKVIDGEKGIADYEEWNSDREMTPWVQLNWNSTQSVSKIVLFDKVSTTDNILDSRLEFSDGTSVSVGSLPNDGAPKEVTFAAKNITWVKFVVLKGEGTSVGLNELEVY